MSITINPIDLGHGRFLYDVFHCRHDYIGIVAPYWCRTAFDGMPILIDGHPAEWFCLPDSRQFTMSLMVRIPCALRDNNHWNVSIGRKEHVAYRRCWQLTRPFNLRHLAMVTMAHYDAAYLGEWIGFHAKLGFEHFYIYNHTGVPEVSVVLQKYDPSLVTEIIWPGPYEADSAWQEPFLSHESHCYTQCPQMMHAALRFGDGWDWMGFFDADEFLCPMTNLGIPEILFNAEQRMYGEVPFVRSAALEVKGKWFGTAGHDSLPTGASVVDTYTRCEEGHTSGTKCFIQPHAVTGTVIHYWDVTGQTARIPDNVLRFNHYRSISPYKNRVGKQFHGDWTNFTTDTRIQDVKRCLS